MALVRTLPKTSLVPKSIGGRLFKPLSLSPADIGKAKISYIGDVGRVAALHEVKMAKGTFRTFYYRGSWASKGANIETGIQFAAKGSNEFARATPAQTEALRTAINGFLEERPKAADIDGRVNHGLLKTEQERQWALRYTLDMMSR